MDSEIKVKSGLNREIKMLPQQLVKYRAQEGPWKEKKRLICAVDLIIHALDSTEITLMSSWKKICGYTGFVL